LVSIGGKGRSDIRGRVSGVLESVATYSTEMCPVGRGIKRCRTGRDTGSPVQVTPLAKKGKEEWWSDTRREWRREERTRGMKKALDEALITKEQQSAGIGAIKEETKKKSRSGHPLPSLVERRNARRLAAGGMKVLKKGGRELSLEGRSLGWRPRNLHHRKKLKARGRRESGGGW